MPRALVNMIKKELREIFRDPRLFIGMILIPLLMFPIMGVAMRGFMSETVQQSYKQVNIGVLNLDNGSLASEILNSPEFIIALDQYNISVTLLNNLGIDTRDEALDFVSLNDSIPALIIIPENFTYCANNQIQIIVEAYIVMKKLSFTIGDIENRVAIFVKVLSTTVSSVILVSINPDANPIFIQNPIIPTQNIIYEGKILKNISPSAVVSFITFQIFMIPMVMMILLVMAIQFAAISIASEKEQKTLETLLSLPVDRSIILLGKLTGALIVAIVGTVGYILGFQFYMSSITENIPTQQISLAELGLGIDSFGYTLLAISLFLSLLSTLSLVTIIAAFAEDVRSAQSLTGVLILPITLIALFSMFGIMFGSLGWWVYILLFIPFTNPMVTPLFVINKEYVPVITGLVALVLETIISIKVAAIFYGSEKILLVRLRLGRRRSREE